jgi:hypothetical protein
MSQPNSTRLEISAGRTLIAINIDDGKHFWIISKKGADFQCPLFEATSPPWQAAADTP